MISGSVCQGGLVPALVRAPLPQVHSSVGLKHFLPFSLEASPSLNLLPTFSSTQQQSEMALAPKSSRLSTEMCVAGSSDEKRSIDTVKA
ncbi:zinc finger protein 385D isoform X1 [Tachysurus ichikawai]